MSKPTSEQAADCAAGEDRLPMFEARRAGGGPSTDGVVPTASPGVIAGENAEGLALQLTTGVAALGMTYARSRKPPGEEAAPAVLAAGLGDVEARRRTDLLGGPEWLCSKSGLDAVASSAATGEATAAGTGLGYPPRPCTLLGFTFLGLASQSDTSDWASSSSSIVCRLWDSRDVVALLARARVTLLLLVTLDDLASRSRRRAVVLTALFAAACGAGDGLLVVSVTGSAAAVALEAAGGLVGVLTAQVALGAGVPDAEASTFAIAKTLLASSSSSSASSSRRRVTSLDTVETSRQKL